MRQFQATSTSSSERIVARKRAKYPLLSSLLVTTILCCNTLAQEPALDAPPTTDTIIAQGIDNEDYIRILFETENTEIQNVTQEEVLVTINFSAPINIDFNNLLFNFPDQIAAAYISSDNLTLFLFLNYQTNVRHFIGENSVGLDIAKTDLEDAYRGDIVTQKVQELVEKKDVVELKTQEPPIEVIETQPDTAPEEEVETPQETDPTAPLDDGSEADFGDDEENDQTATTETNILEPTTEESNATDEAETTSNTPIPEGLFADESILRNQNIRLFDKPVFKEDEPVVFNPAPEDKPLSIDLPNWEVQQENINAQRTRYNQDGNIIKLNLGEIPIQKATTEEGIELGFDWQTPTAAASFSQGDILWVVFNNAKVLRLEALKDDEMIEAAEQIDHPFFTILKLYIRPPYTLDSAIDDERLIFPSMKRDNDRWDLSLIKAKPGELENEYPKRLDVSLERDDDGPRIFISAPRPTDSLPLEDDELGEVIHIIPLYQSNYGVIPGRSFVDTEILPTAQGIAFKPTSDTMSHTLERAGVGIFSRRSLNISPDLLRDAEREQKLRALDEIDIIENDVIPDTSIMPFDIWGNEQGDSFIEERRRLYNELTAIPEDEKTKKRMEIAKFFFGRGLFAETVGVLRDIKTLDPTYENMQQVNLLEGVSQYMLGHYRDAEEIFATEAKKIKDEENFNELRLWQWASKYQYSKTDKQSRQVAIPIDYVGSYDKFMLNYPPAIRYDIGLLATQERVENNDPSGANTIMEIISYDYVPDKYDNDTSYFYGKIAQMQGNIKRAYEMWEPLANNTKDRKNRARSSFELNKLRLEKEEITKQEAIDTLETLLNVWRGDQLEVDMLKLLGQWYMDTNQFAKGLSTWQNLVTNFPNTKEALFTAGRMKQRFIKLFDGGEAYELNPFDALGLYFKFRELTPVGSDGDRIIQQLATHFINADLIDNSIAILTHQLRYRDVAEKRNELAIRLANLQLINRRPENVPDALSYMEFKTATPAELRSAKYIRGRALIMQGDHKEAQDLLVGDFSDEAQNLRMEIFWKNENWFGIMNIVESRLYRYRDNAPIPLAEDEFQDVARLALAYSAQNLYDDLDTLRTDFGNRLNDPYQQKLFNFLTQRFLDIDHKELEDTVQMSDITEFVNNYGFWPAQRWKDAINILAPKVENMDGRGELTLDQQKDVVRLTIAISMRRKELDIDDNYDDSLELKRLENLNKLVFSDFRNVRIDSTTLDVFKTFDDRLSDKHADEDIIFQHSIPLTRVEEFISQYRGAKTIEELNTIIQ